MSDAIADAALLQDLGAALVVVALVGIELDWTLAGPRQCSGEWAARHRPCPPTYGYWHVRCAHADSKRDAVGVGDHMTFGAGLAAVSGVRVRRLPTLSVDDVVEEVEQRCRAWRPTKRSCQAPASL